jgi:DNA replication protein DnaC
MNLIELNRALRQLRLGGIAAVLETRLRQAQAETMTPIDFLSCLVSDELTRRGERLLERRRKQAEFRDPQKTLDSFDFNFNKKMNRSLVFDLATGTFIARHEDALFLGPPGSGKSHLAQAIGQAAIQQGYRVLYREAHKLLDDLAEATIDGTRKEQMELFASVPLLIIDDLGMRKLPVIAAEELLEIVMRRYERTSTLLTSNRPVETFLLRTHNDPTSEDICREERIAVINSQRLTAGSARQEVGADRSERNCELSQQTFDFDREAIHESYRAKSSSSEPKHLTAHAGRRLQGSVARLRNDLGLRKSPIPHQT